MPPAVFDDVKKQIGSAPARSSTDGEPPAARARTGSAPAGSRSIVLVLGGLLLAGLAVGRIAVVFLRGGVRQRLLGRTPRNDEPSRAPVIALASPTFPAQAEPLTEPPVVIAAPARPIPRPAPSPLALEPAIRPRTSLNLASLSERQLGSALIGAAMGSVVALAAIVRAARAYRRGGLHVR